MNIFIKDYSIISALGNGKEAHRKNVTLENLARKAQEFEMVDGKIAPIFVSDCSRKVYDSLPTKFKTRNNALLKILIDNLSVNLENLFLQTPKNKIGIILATSTSGIDEGYQALANEDAFNHYEYAKQEMSSLSEYISYELDLRGINYTISTACSSGARAFIEGANLIKNQICDAVIVGASDTINPLTINGFHSLESISRKIVNPFGKSRNGINIGEAAGLFILTKEKSPLCLLGYGESSDGYHASSPDPTAKEAINCMNQALNMAKLHAGSIQYVNLHGTGTIKNDSMEALAIKSVFPQDVAISSTKPFTGHCLGAAGAIEAGICLSLLESSTEVTLPPHIIDDEYDESINLNFVRPGTKIKPHYIMSNSYAFGGNNCSLIFGRNND